jgi:threonine dehydrogenase-like Zn-dependent dehydrogenase
MAPSIMTESCQVHQFEYNHPPYINECTNRFRSISMPTPADRCCQAAAYIVESNDPVVAVIGVGYVGLELVIAFSKHYTVIAFDISSQRISTLRQEQKNLTSVTFTSDQSMLSRGTHFLVSVPTPLLPNRQIDTSCLESAITTVARYARPGATVVMESSVPVGMTRKLMAPIMNSRGLKAGMSPEVGHPFNCQVYFNEGMLMLVTACGPRSIRTCFRSNPQNHIGS